MNPSLSKRRVIKKTSPMNKSLYTSSITFKSFEKTILFSTDGSDEEYETAEDVHDEINPAASTSGEVKSEHPPVYIPEDIPIPDRFELRESHAFPGLGVWTKQLVQIGEKFGPFSGVLSFTSNNSATSWKVGFVQLQIPTYLSTGVKTGVRRNKISIFIPCVLFPVNSPILVLHYC